MTVTTKDRQTLYDIAIAYLGTSEVSAVFKLLEGNPNVQFDDTLYDIGLNPKQHQTPAGCIDITKPLMAGQTLIINDYEEKNTPVIKKLSGYVPQTVTSRKLNEMPEYLIVYKDADGTVLKTETVSYGSDAVAPADPTLEGYDFTGWDTDFTKVESDLIVTALYAASEKNVQFIDWDGSLLKEQSVPYGESAVPPTEPSRTGYTFIGWEPAYDNITGPLTISAVYQIIEYTVVFKDWNGTVLKIDYVGYDRVAVPPADPTREGYDFTGWDAGFTNVTQNLIVTAVYQTAEHTVQFLDWDGTVLKIEIVMHGSDAVAPADPTREDYDFTGWDSDFTNVTQDLTVTALYTEVPEPIVLVDRSAGVTALFANADFSMATPFTLSAPAIIEKVKLYHTYRNGSIGNVIISVYDDNNGTVGNIMHSGSFPITDSPEDASNAIDIILEFFVNLNGGIYWLTVATDSSTFLCRGDYTKNDSLEKTSISTGGTGEWVPGDYAISFQILGYNQ